MADDGFWTTIAGVVQFGPDERETSAGTIRVVRVRSVRDGDSVDVTLWPQFDELKLEQGDAIFVDGKASVYRGEKGDRKQISATHVSVIPHFPVPEREVENKRSSRGSGRGGKKSSGTPF